MHMSDALVSPEVGSTMWVVSAVFIAYACKKVARDTNDRKIPLMGMLGAFVFAAQMINFSIPMTGSSGHLGGGLLLAVLLGPWGGIVAMASILAIQALLFADGGILAFGCNLFNMGVIPCIIAYPLIYKLIVRDPLQASFHRVMWGCMAGAVVALQLGAFAVVLETVSSGISELPFSRFAQLMQPIHLGIGLVEGAATAGIVLFLKSMQSVPGFDTPPQRKHTAILKVIALCSLITAGIVSWYASEHPDGLEWAIFRTAQAEDIQLPSQGIHESLAHVQAKTAVLPDYAFPASEGEKEESSRLQTSISGILGSSVVLVLLAGTGWLLRKTRRTASA